MQLRDALKMTRKLYQYRVVIRYNYYDPNVKAYYYNYKSMRYEYGVRFYFGNDSVEILVKVEPQDVGLAPGWLWGDESIYERTDNYVQRQARTYKKYRGVETPTLSRLVDNKCRVSRRGRIPRRKRPCKFFNGKQDCNGYDSKHE